ncbi:MAG TPA: CDP-alcohol phosphatidyltransferase family protein [Solirubrobacter sp.]|nr:CDP-alcohol phosphatidyltransferase family protein [Solirubrobacter sp.]
MTASARSSPPSIAELRRVTQPESIMGRANAEHWAGRLYMRRLSPYVTRLLLRTRISADGVTWLMFPTGLGAALALTWPGLGGAILAVLLIQAQLLVDCCDGEVARWRQTSSPAGIFLDRLAHHTTDAAIAIALGVRADGGWDELGGWTTLGCLIAVLGLLIKAETLLVPVARAAVGRPPAADTAAVASPRGGVLRRARRAAGLAPLFRALVTVETTLLALAAAIADVIAGGLDGTQVLVVALVPVATLTLLGHLAGILASNRLR